MGLGIVLPLFLTRNEWLRLVEVSPVALDTETADGANALETAALRWGKHTAFRARVRIATPIPAPNALVNCAARLKLGATVLQREDFLVRLDRVVQEAKLQRFDLLWIEPEKQNQHLRLLLTLDLDGLQKLVWPLIAAAAEHASNFEGQLRCPASELPLDEKAYAEIVTELIAPSDAPAKRGR